MRIDRFRDAFGRGRLLAAPYLLSTVRTTRYFEVGSVVEDSPPCSRCLDPSSPRPLSFFVGSVRPYMSIDMLNPDREDSASKAVVAQRIQEYERVWMATDTDHTLGDPRPITDAYDPFNSLGSMPPFGICMLMIDRPAEPEERSNP